MIVERWETLDDLKARLDDLRQEGGSAEAFRRVFAPAGLDIGSPTVPEIAVAVCAELVSLRNRGEVSGCPEAVPVVD